MHDEYHKLACSITSILLCIDAKESLWVPMLCHRVTTH